MQRDLERKLSDEDYERHKGTMILAELALTQAKKTKGKVYSMHAPEVECIAKGKAHKPYEFGVKTSLATTAWGGFALGAMSLPGNPFDGHTLEEQLEQVERLAGTMPKRCHVDRGYTIRLRRIGRNGPRGPLPPEGRGPKARVRGHGVDSEICRVIIAGSRKGLSKALKQEMKRRSSIEPEIGHQKFDGKLGRNWLKGMLGDAQNAILCAAGHNLRKILAHLRRLFVLAWAWLMAALRPVPPLPVSGGTAA